MYRIFIGLTLLLLSNAALATDSPGWEKTLEQAAESVVSIRISVVRSFDTEGSSTVQATGFVVDAERGIILTNRHVVNPGPIIAEAIFANNEEIELKPIYRDPVHDFGFFQYDPKALQFIHPKSLKLAEHGARIGDDIKVIGNDSGEHMSILSGTLARLDRSAPKYQRGGYNDFNTFYFQSSADTSGGSSGAPVINIKGQVIALNAGANQRSSASFFLPLYKITRALSAIQKGLPITRGTIETTLDYQPYDEVRRLGLPEATEKKFRKKNHGNGLLVVEQTVVDGAAYKLLRPGDIIIGAQSANQQLDYVTRYEDFEIFLDEHVGQTITLNLLRQGNPVTVTLNVTDLHAITPDEYLQIAGGIFHNFSYHLARQTNLATRGVYIATPGYMFGNVGIGRGIVIQALNDSIINNLDDFQQALSKLKQNENFNIKFVSITAPTNQLIRSVKFQTNWHDSERCHRNDEQGIWDCQRLQWQQTSKPLPPTQVKLTSFTDRQTASIAASLVMVTATLPYHVDGQNFDRYSGTGLVLDAAQGLVLVDRNTVPIKMVNVTINVSGIADIPAEVVFIHPLHSFALIQYDPKLLAGNPLKSAPISTTPLSAGDAAWLVGYQASNRLISEKVNVSSVESLTLPQPEIPQFRDTNSDSLLINNPPDVASGVLIDRRGKVRAWWTNYNFAGSDNTIDRGLSLELVNDLLEQWHHKKSIEVFSLEVELRPITIAMARNFGLSDDWMEKLQDDIEKPQALKIVGRVAGSDAFTQLRDGDLLLAIDGHPVRDFKEFEQNIHKASVKVSVWRDGQQVDLTIATKILSDTDTNEIYLWSGALLQKPHRAVAAQFGIESKGVYISWYFFGSPANRYNLRPLMRITEIEGEAVNDLAQFIELSKKYRDRNYLRIRLLDLVGRESIITLKQDHRYWPTQRIFWDGNAWHNQLVDK